MQFSNNIQRPQVAKFQVRLRNLMRLIPIRSQPVAAAMLCLLMLTALATATPAHPISVTETHIFVTQHSARARIQLFAEDLLLFHELEPNDDGVVPADELRCGLREHGDFLKKRVTLRDEKGELIPSRVTDVIPFEIPDEGILEEDLMLYQATYELEFTFAAPPEFLTFQQDITDDNFIIPSEMKVAIHQTGTGNTIAGTLLPGGAVTHRFDWETPLDVEASDAEFESWLEKQRQDTLGITSYSSVYSFIYMEPGEVRHELLIPLASLATILPMEQADPAFLDVEEQEAVRDRIREWLGDGNPAKINGATAPVEFSRIDFYGLSLRDFAQQAKAQRVSLASGRVGIILRYLPAADFVSDIELTWDTFHSSLRKIRSVVMPWNGRVDRFEFSRFKQPEDNVFCWTADSSTLPTPTEPVRSVLPEQPRMRIPVLTCVFTLCAVLSPAVTRRRWPVSVVCCVLAVACWPVGGATVPHPFRSGKVPEQEAGLIVEQLHLGTYQALEYGMERRVYAALDQVVDGELLEVLYLQLRQDLAVKDQGGAVARVRSVEFIDGEYLDRQPDHLAWPGFRYRNTWTVSGTVEHWGHVHERRNRFSAILDVEPRDGFWKITGMQIDEKENLAGSTQLREF